MKISVRRRKFVIRRKQQLKAKLRKLRKQFAAAKTKEQKEDVVKKLGRIAPHLHAGEYLGIK
ncbi:MAG: hypothetical protein HYW95_01725 [Candidatus Wildermuthbacteria bacterium]|nr:hypothetical protein [Candidatus Wildermuthbacteria bacterium]